LLFRRFVTSIAYVIYATLMAAFLAGYTARFVHPGTFWWLQLVAIPLPYLSAVVVLAALPLLLARRWKLLAFNVALMVLVAIRFAPTGGGADPTEFAVGERLSIMTLNYPSQYSRDGGARSLALLNLVRQERPDVIGLQEGWAHYSEDGSALNPRRDMTVLTDSAAYLTLGPQGRDRSVSHVPIYSLFPFDQVNRFILGPDRSGFGAGVTRAEATWRRRTLVIYNIHLQSFGSKKPWREENTRWLNPRTVIRYLRQYRNEIVRRSGQAEQLAAMLKDETDPVIVMGDFNSTRHNWDFNHIREGFQDAFAIAGSGRGATYHARYRFARIDFILASPEFFVLSAHVPRVVLSDHRPVVASVAWRE